MPTTPNGIAAPRGDDVDKHIINTGNHQQHENEEHAKRYVGGDVSETWENPIVVVARVIPWSTPGYLRAVDGTSLRRYTRRGAKIDGMTSSRGARLLYRFVGQLSTDGTCFMLFEGDITDDGTWRHLRRMNWRVQGGTRFFVGKHLQRADQVKSVLVTRVEEKGNI